MSAGERGRDVDWDEMVLVGVIARTHGNKGQVILNSTTDFPELRFREGARVFGRREHGPIESFEITSVRFQQGRPILGLAGFATIGEAERLAGVELRIPVSEQQALPDGSFYHHELIGCEVVTAGGEAIGTVVEIQGDGAATRLLVRGGRGEVMIPLAREMCDIDIARKRVVVTLPEGLLEVNGGWR